MSESEVAEKVKLFEWLAYRTILREPHLLFLAVVIGDLAVGLYPRDIASDFNRLLGLIVKRHDELSKEFNSQKE